MYGLEFFALDLCYTVFSWLVYEIEETGKEAIPTWNDITELSEHVQAFDKRIDVACLAETTLLDELGFIECDPCNQNVRLTDPGRENSDRDIIILYYN